MVSVWITAFYAFLNTCGYTHPIHPALVHFPIGLMGGALIFGWIGTLFHRETLVFSARHCLTLAFFFWFPVVLFGYMDWQHFYGGLWLAPIKVKIVLSSILFFLLVLGLFNDYRKRRNPKAALLLYTLLLCTAAGLGFMGAQLVYGSKSPAIEKTHTAGEKIFAENCRACHPNGGNSIDPKHPLIPSPQMENLTAFTVWLRHPAPAMPAFPENRLSSAQVKELYAYLSDPQIFSRPNKNAP